MLCQLTVHSLCIHLFPCCSAVAVALGVLCIGLFGRNMGWEIFLTSKLLDRGIELESYTELLATDL